MVPNLRNIADKTLEAIGCLPIQPEIRVLSGRCGLFSDLFMALNSIQICKKYKLSGRIHWGRRSLYFDRKLAGNAYEYFFKDASFRFSNRCVLKGVALPYLPSGDAIRVPRSRTREGI